MLFESKRIAHGYARHRPQFQTDAVRHIREDLGLSRQLDSALDVGCGTGLSTVPLLGLAASVVGADPSYAMIFEAQPQSSVHYCVATAEALPFASKSFDLITVSGAYDWIDADLFLPTAQHLLREGGWLVIYDGGETGVMIDKPSFQTWYQGSYLTRYPKPSRRKPTMGSAIAQSNGFVFERSRHYTVDIPFTLEAYVDFSMTQSMITFAIERGQEDLIALSNWLRRACTPFFLSHSETVVEVWYTRDERARDCEVLHPHGGVLYKSGVYARNVLCRTLGDLPVVWVQGTEGGEIRSDHPAEVSRGHRRPAIAG